MKREEQPVYVFEGFRVELRQRLLLSMRRRARQRETGRGKQQQMDQVGVSQGPDSPFNVPVSPLEAKRHRASSIINLYDQPQARPHPEAPCFIISPMLAHTTLNTVLLLFFLQLNRPVRAVVIPTSGAMV